MSLLSAPLVPYHTSMIKKIHVYMATLAGYNEASFWSHQELCVRLANGRLMQTITVLFLVPLHSYLYFICLKICHRPGVGQMSGTWPVHRLDECHRDGLAGWIRPLHLPLPFRHPFHTRSKVLGACSEHSEAWAAHSACFGTQAVHGTCPGPTPGQSCLSVTCLYVLPFWHLGAIALLISNMNFNVATCMLWCY